MTDGAATGRPAARVPAAALRRFACDVFVAAGLARAHAETVADVLVWADLRGVESHGVARIPMYLRLLDAGDLNPAPAIAILTDTPAAVVLEMDRAAGPVAMTMAAAAAVDKARAAGIGFALARATTHTAALGYYTSAVARDGIAAIAFAASVPMMAYHGARVAGVSTSPISIAVPGERGPLVLDMAASMISAGALTQARRAGRAIPPGAALDASGRPTTDPAAATTPRPLGGYKGSGLSLMIECLASLLASNPIIADALAVEGGPHRQNGLVLAIDVARFADPVVFRAEVERLITAVKALPREPGVAEILVPGERGHRTVVDRQRNGISLSQPVIQDLGRAAERFGVRMPGD